MVLDVRNSAVVEAADEESDEYDVVSIESNSDSCNKNDSVEIFEDSVQPSFGNIAVNNSADVHFGNKTYYQGPVTIKQILYTNPKNEQIDSAPRLSVEDVVKDGKLNGAFETDSPEVKTANGDKVTANGKDIIANNKWNPILSHKRIFIVATLVAVLLISSIILLAVLLPKYIRHGNSTQIPRDTDEQETGEPITYIDPTVKLTLSGKLKVISRLEWVAQPPVEPATPLKHPVPYVIIMHTATENCSEQSGCTFHVRFIQSYHIDSRGWWDIGYNFLVGGDGFAYEGRGWNGEGAHTYGYNARSIGIAFIGTFNKILPPLRQIVAAQQLIKKGVEKGYIAKDYKLLAALQLQTTQSPGKLLFENMKNWTNWAETP